MFFIVEEWPPCIIVFGKNNNAFCWIKSNEKTIFSFGKILSFNLYIIIKLYNGVFIRTSPPWRRFATTKSLVNKTCMNNSTPYLSLTSVYSRTMISNRYRCQSNLFWYTCFSCITIRSSMQIFWCEYRLCGWFLYNRTSCTRSWRYL